MARGRFRVESPPESQQARDPGMLWSIQWNLVLMEQHPGWVAGPVSNLIRRQVPRGADVFAGWGQAVWWRERELRYLLIDDMDERYRRNVLNFLLTRAPAIAHRAYRSYFFWSPLALADYKGDAPPDLEIWDEAKIWSESRRVLDTGLHYDVLRSSPLYLRLSEGLEPEPNRLDWRPLWRR